MFASAIAWIIVSCLGIYFLAPTTGIFFGVLKIFLIIMLFAGIRYAYNILKIRAM